MAKLAIGIKSHFPVIRIISVVIIIKMTADTFTRYIIATAMADLTIKTFMVPLKGPERVAKFCSGPGDSTCTMADYTVSGKISIVVIGLLGLIVIIPMAINTITGQTSINIPLMAVTTGSCLMFPEKWKSLMI